MPTYEYACDACGYQFETFQSITARALRKCPQCGKLKLSRLIGTGAGIIFKGSGFYETDYRSEGYKEAKKKESGGGDKEGKAASDKKDKPKSEGKGKAADSGTAGGAKTNDA